MLHERRAGVARGFALGGANARSTPQYFAHTLIERPAWNQYRSMRLLLGVAGAVAFAGALGACAAISGLGAYSTADCPADGCDASVPPGPEAAPEGGVGPGVDASPDADDGDDGAAEDGEPNGGCDAGLLMCEGGCLDPSSATSCGGCDNACGGDAALCASQSEGTTFACASSCPPATPTACNGRCVNTSSDPNNCMTCGYQCSTEVAHAHPVCGDGGCAFACDSSYTYCGTVCVDFMNDSVNCGGCGPTHVCASGTTCVSGVCTSLDGGSDAAGPPPCPDGGCPNSTPTGFSCPFGHCNGTSGECTSASGCFCSSDTLCASKKCVKVTGENDVSCGSTGCTGSGGRDGFDCELASPGIPSLATGSTYSCPANSGYKNTTLTCDPTHTNCYCTADAECPSGKCIPSSNNGNCSGCSGTGTADFRGCEPIAAIGNCPIYIGCNMGVCSYPVCYCLADSQCGSGRCIPSAHNGNCSGCTGTGTDDGHGCEPAPSSVACMGIGGTMCITTLTPPPVANSGKTACLCVADSNCPSGKCVNADSQCTGTCTGSAPMDSEDCETATSIANAWSCSIGNCSNVTSPSGSCTAGGVPSWCTSDSQCPSGTQCASWAGCASGACTGSGTANAFHCAP
jgi:hypothetical protein